MTPSRFRSQLWLTLSLSCCILSLSGCGRGPELAIVSGSVELEGVPVDGGQIQFEDVTGEVSSAGGKIEQGRFELNALPAQFKVRIVAYREVPGKFLEMNPGVKTPFIEQYIPAQFNEKSELTASLTPGKNQLNFSLTKTESPKVSASK